MRRKKPTLLALLCVLLGVVLTACAGRAAAPEPTPTPTPSPTPEPELLPQVCISELMSDNESTFALTDGSFPAWLELLNTGAEPADLSGFVLRLGEEEWTIPELSLEPGEYRLVYCDGNTGADDGLHSSFVLDKEGRVLSLVSPRGTELESMKLPRLGEDVSWSLGEDGSFAECRLPSPGEENCEAGYLACQTRRTASTQDLSLSEVMVYNEWYLPQNGEYYDWVEIRNDTARTLELSDYYLSDKLRERQLYRLPEQTLAPGECMLVFCSGDSAGDSIAPFGLSSDKENLYLTRTDGTLCDYLCLRDIPMGCSFGRMPKQGGGFYFAVPSPGEENSGGVRFAGEKPVALSPDGIFDDVSSVKVEIGGVGTIRYTLDGSVPTEESEIYTKPFTLTETGVVRARSFRDNCLPSETLSLSYLVNEGHSLPVVSLVCDPEDMFGRSGIYTNPGEKWERAGCMLFYADGERFEIDCGIKLHGATSRFNQSKKSFKIMFRERYGGRLHYDLFGNGVLDFSSVLLRAAQEADQSTFMRDNLMHQLSMQAFPELPAEDYRYSVLYINGEYRGIYNIREAHSATHYAEHYGYDEETVSQWQGEWPHKSFIDEVFQFAQYNDLSKDENYNYVSRYVNTDSVIAWCIMQVYSGNFDFNSPNMRFYYSTQDQQLRYALVDLDLGMFDVGYFGAIFGFGYAYNDLARDLMQNRNFRLDFIRQLKKALDGPLSNENAVAVIDRLADELRPEVERDHALWGGSLKSWERMVEHLREYIEIYPGRAEYMIESLRTSGFVKRDEMDIYFP